ncbi:MAG TPA: transcription termination/antitermination NusG family protein [Pyrinomonadaceae bacterium]|jgi:transcriptional antiterminator RfaH|nr:transcription termination/antitermination NusG family protein [Pyrinomonadaceae bacterium]
MNTQMVEEIPRWYVVHTHPKQEDRANMNLLAGKVETFMPKRRERKYDRYQGALNYFTKPLFPSYLFARFKAGDLLRTVRFTRGVHSVVSFGNAPTPVDDEIIALIQSYSNKDGVISISEEFKSGDEVIIKEGLLRGFTGIFERRMKDADRVMILLKTVSYQSHIILESSSISKSVVGY